MILGLGLEVYELRRRAQYRQKGLMHDLDVESSIATSDLLH